MTLVPRCEHGLSSGSCFDCGMLSLSEILKHYTMKTRCKFNCESVTNYLGMQSVKFSTVKGDDEENDYSKYTPSGELEITLDASGSSYDKFTPGNRYYLDIIECE